ncbi:unnamed protein product, partial [Pylaiella littoralis]
RAGGEFLPPFARASQRKSTCTSAQEDVVEDYNLKRVKSTVVKLYHRRDDIRTQKHHQHAPRDLLKIDHRDGICVQNPTSTRSLFENSTGRRRDENSRIVAEESGNAKKQVKSI